MDDDASATAAAAVVVDEVPDMRVDADADADPGGGLFTALAALCDILLLVPVVAVAYPRPIVAQHAFCAAMAKHRSVPLALRPQCSAHIRLS